jgi:hypothetical protein
MRTSADDASGQWDAGPRTGSGPRPAHSHRSAARRGAEEPPGAGSAEDDRPRSSRYWPGVAEAVPGKGPVRGYPPVPGQPPPVYPPGQFAAWNQRLDGRTGDAGSWADPAGHAGSADPADHAAPPAALAGPPADPAGPLAGPPGLGSRSGPRGGRHSQPPRRAAAGGTSLSRYYARDADDGPEPGYPVLAVSDPAADVTSTQTWRAIADGRSTGIWAAPAADRTPVRAAHRTSVRAAHRPARGTSLRACRDGSAGALTRPPPARHPESRPGPPAR